MIAASQPGIELLKSLQLLAPHAGWVVLVGPLPAGEEQAWIQAVAEEGRQVLVILPGLDAEQGQALRQQLPEQVLVGVTFCCELLGAEPGEVCWYRYNDRRHNGTTSPELLQTNWPNLRLESLELRPQRTLAEVLDQWMADEAQPLEAEGSLWLPAASASDVLAGAGSWLSSLSAIAVAGSMDASHPLAARLEPACFRAEDVGPQLQLWRRDPLLVLHAEREELRIQMQTLEGEKSTLQAECEGVIAEREGLRIQMQALNSERASLQAERNALQEQRDALQTERDGLQVERDDLSSRLLTLTSEFQELASQRQELSGQLETLSTQRDGLQQERDRLNAERSELQSERDNLQEEKNHLATEKQQLRGALEHVFPYGAYKEKRADLSQHDDSQLIDHFVRCGISEGVHLHHAPMKQRLEDCQKENRKLNKESALIQQELSKAQIHMELLKELIGK